MWSLALPIPIRIGGRHLVRAGQSKVDRDTPSDAATLLVVANPIDSTTPRSKSNRVRIGETLPVGRYPGNVDTRAVDRAVFGGGDEFQIVMTTLPRAAPLST